MRGIVRRAMAGLLAMTMIVTMCPQTQLMQVSADDSANTPYCISVGRPVYASSQNGGEAPENAVDNNTGSRWQAGNDDKNEWFYVDLGKVADIDHIYIHWEAAYAKSYEIQFSDDEENWRTVYTKGKGANTDDSEPQEMSLSRGEFSTKTFNGEERLVADLKWSEISGVSYYYIYLDDVADKQQATAADGYPFGGNWGTRTSCEVWFREGEHTYTVVAYDESGNELASASMVFDTADIEEEITTEDTQGTQNALEHTINFDNLGTSEKQARYVKIICTERQMEAYGSSFYEFQVYGTNGKVKRPADYGENLALGKSVEYSGIPDEWWMYDENGNIPESKITEMRGENVVDGNSTTYWTSPYKDNQCLYVDLGANYTIGRITLDWTTDAGKIYDIDVSSDGENWTTVHRVLRGYTEMKDNFTLYQENVRYVRFYGYTRVESGNGFRMYELGIYEYKEGDSKENETIEDLPVRQIIDNEKGKGTYVSGEMYKEMNKLPTFVNEETIQTPIDSNNWWSSALMKTFSNLFCIHPFKASFSKKGLGILTATDGWVGVRGETDLGTDQSSETGIDFYISPENYDSTSGYDRVEQYGDYSVQLGLIDGDGLQMKTTFVKGAPYLYNEFCDNTVVLLSSATITEIFDGEGNAILENRGDEVVTDHIGFTSVDAENTKAGNAGSYYCINVPAGTKFKTMVAGSSYKIKITFPSADENYMSVATMTDKGDINDYYEHGYAFVTDTYIGYEYNQDNSKVITDYTVTTKLMRSGFSNVTMQTLYPHQWKYSDDADNEYAVYESIRGDMKAIWANKFTTTQQFAGLLPTFATPDSELFDSEELIEYLNAVVAAKIDTAPVADAYWEGKNVHPLAISALMADQLGETEIKDKLLKKLKSIMVDWFYYDGEDDECYLIYNKDWGTLYYPNSSFGANAAICDHNFTYGYFVFGAAVLATYDKEFYNDYKDMIELLIRDYADPMEPEDDGNMFCKFRSFDQYSGHSWAGGYGDNDSGNNQESASEALFAWVGMYLWGEVSQNNTYIDAGAYGFTTEMQAVLEYWFDYDETNWLEEYPFEAVGQIYGGSMGYGTFFGGQPVYVYGIQWLPISEYLTNYGMNQERCAEIYAGLEYDTQYAINIETILHQEELDKGLPESEWWHNPDTYVTPDTGWQHITWPFLSQTDPLLAYEKFSANVTKVQTEDRANTLWFISAMDQLGYRTKEYAVTGNITGSVYCKESDDGTKVYTAEVWNPTSTTQTVTVKDASGTVLGTAKIQSKALVSFEIDTTKTFSLNQTSTPTVKATALSDGTVTNKITGEVTFDDTQIVEISCANSGSTIYYTTDGTVPTTESNVYTGKFIVSSDTSIKAIAVKKGYIDSSVASTVINIAGDTVSNDDNLALNGTASASSEAGDGAKAYMAIDGDTTSRWQAAGEEDADNEWFQVELAQPVAINSVMINWEAAYAAKYEIQVSLDGENWTTVAKENGYVGEITSNFAATKARYVRMQGLSRGTAYGYSFFEFEVYGALKASAPVISHDSGTYEDSQEVTLTSDVKGAEIKYTLDGSEPTEKSATYTEPLAVSQSTQIKAVTYRKGMVLSDVAESTIIIAGTITINPASAKLASDRTKQLTVLTDEKVTWSSSNTKAATVDANGLVSGKNVGETVITAKTAGGKTATCKITVIEPIHIKSIELSESELEIKNKTSMELEVIINPADTTDDTTAVWKSSDESIVKVNDDGVLSAKAEGEATVTVTIGNHTAECKVIVGPAASAAEMAASGKYNLALKKNVEVYPGVAEGNIKNINDGSLVNGSYGALSKVGWNYSSESYAIIDLGYTYDAATIDLIAVQYVRNSADVSVNEKYYTIEYSANGVDFEEVYKSNKITEADFDDSSVVYADVSGNTGAVRYVKVYYPTTAGYGMQISEIAVLSTEQNAAKIEVEMLDDLSDVIVTSEAFCQITYTIEPAEGQEDYKYIVYLDGSKVASLIDAGTYTIDEVEAGVHTVKVVAYYDKKVSEGISKEVEVDDGSLKAYVGTSRNLSKGATVTVDAINSGEEGSKDTAVLTDGKLSTDNNQVVQTTYGNKNAELIMDLGKSIAKDQIDEVLIAFKENNTTATAYEIEFSSDGANYETVAEVTGTVWKQAFEDKFDSDAYTQDTVRYVRITLTDGNVNWGYQISEIAIMGTDEYMPKEAQNVVVTSTENNKITVTFEDGKENQTYDIYVNGAIKRMNITAGLWECTGIDGGTCTVKVVAKYNDITSKGVTVTVEVKEEPTTAGPEPEEPSDEEEPDDEEESNEQESSSDGSSENESNQDESQSSNTPGGSGNSGNTDNAGNNGNTGNSENSGNNGNTSNSGVQSGGNSSSDSKISIKIGRTKVKKATKKKANKAKITLKKIKGVTGYQVKISTTKKFKKKSTVTKKVKKYKATIKIKKLKKRKKYYIKARAYKIVDGEIYYGKWSKVKRVKNLK